MKLTKPSIVMKQVDVRLRKNCHSELNEQVLNLSKCRFYTAFRMTKVLLHNLTGGTVIWQTSFITNKLAKPMPYLKYKKQLPQK